MKKVILEQIYSAELNFHQYSVEFFHFFFVKKCLIFKKKQKRKEKKGNYFKEEFDTDLESLSEEEGTELEEEVGGSVRTYEINRGSFLKRYFGKLEDSPFKL